MRNQRGFSLMEIMLGASLAGGAMMAISFGLASLKRTEVALGEKGDANTQMVFATRLIQRVGRVSSQCRLAAGTMSLECFIDFTRPAAGTPQWVRFLMVGGALEYQLETDPAGPGTFADVRTHTRWDQVADVYFCDSTAMTPGASTCDLAPIALSTFFHQYANGTVAPAIAGNGHAARYFRYRLTSIPVGPLASTGAGTATKVPMVHQGAFYLRNPAASSVAYQW